MLFSHSAELSEDTSSRKRAIWRKNSRAWYAANQQEKIAAVTARLKQDEQAQRLHDARAFIAVYLQRGVLIRPPRCEVRYCGGKPQPFHPDPTQPRLFAWLCRRCRIRVLGHLGEAVTVKWQWPARFDHLKPGPGNYFSVVVVREISDTAAGIVIPPDLPTIDQERIRAEAEEAAARFDAGKDDFERLMADVDALNARIDARVPSRRTDHA